MTLSELGALGEFVGGIAVLVTLIYLAVQIRQSRKLTETSVHIALAANVAAKMQAIIPDDMVDVLDRSLSDPDDLDSRARLALDCWWGLYVNNRQSEFREHRLGLYSQRFWEGFEAMVQEDLSGAFARDWWMRSGRRRVDVDFRDYVDALLGIAAATEVR
jgi:hypothetical protein